jgi:MOSC domain-containing protein YiiM
MQARQQINVVAGSGIEGDRYSVGTGHFSRPDRSGEDITLIESEAIEAVVRDYKLDLDGADARRNVVTAGVALNHLVGRELRVGPVLIRGVELAEPCSHLEKLTGIRGLRASLVHRGGLRADVLVGGIVRVGDPIRPEGPAPLAGQD